MRVSRRRAADKTPAPGAHQADNIQSTPTDKTGLGTGSTSQPEAANTEPVPVSKGAEEATVGQLRATRDVLWAMGRWVINNAVVAAAFAGVYTWACGFEYLSGFYSRFDVEPSQIGMGRTEVIGRALAYGVIFGLLFAGIIGITAGLLRLAGPLTDEEMPRRKRWSKWLARHLREIRLIMAPVIAVLLIVLATLPILLGDLGYREADHFVSATKSDPDSTFFQEFFGARPRLVYLYWVSQSPSPLRLVSNDSQSKVEAPQNEVGGFLLGEANGVTIFFSLGDCAVYHLPTSAVSMTRRLLGSRASVADVKSALQATKPSC